MTGTADPHRDPTAVSPAAVAAFASVRPLLFSIAYRMLSTVSDAEDVVQEAFLRYERTLAGGTTIRSPKAYLSAVTTRLAIDHLKSARVRRETYVGQWLPEPVLTGGPAGPMPADPAELAEQSDSLSMAFLLVLERLDPVERAVFLLHDVFGYPFGEIATVVGRSADNCRQIGVRARRRVGEQRPRFEADRKARDELADRFLAAVVDGDLTALVGMLAADAVVLGDSGGTGPSWPRPIVGPDKVARLLIGLIDQITDAGLHLQRVEVNGGPGAVVRDGTGKLVNVFSLEITDGAVQTVRSIISRPKLAHLGPLADIDAILQERHERRVSGPAAGAGPAGDTHH